MERLMLHTSDDIEFLEIPETLFQEHNGQGNTNNTRKKGGSVFLAGWYDISRFLDLLRHAGLTPITRRVSYGTNPVLNYDLYYERAK